MILLRDEKDDRLLRKVDIYFDYFTTEWVETGESEMSFSIPATKEHLEDIQEERIIVELWNRWIIKSIDIYVDIAIISCRLDVTELLENPIVDFRETAINLDSCLRLALTGTGWDFWGSELGNKQKTIELEAGNVLDLLRVMQNVYGTTLRYDGLTKIIYIYLPEKYENKGAYFIDSVNIKSISNKSDTYDYCTRLYAYGENNLNFASINNGLPYIEDLSYNGKIVTSVWKDERYSVEENLLEDAKIKLAELCKPHISYEVNVIDLWNLDKEKYKNLKIEIGDKITLINPFRGNNALEFQVVKYIHYHEEPERNSIELGNVSLDLSDYLTDNTTKELAKIMDRIGDKIGYITGYNTVVHEFTNTSKIVAECSLGLDLNTRLDAQIIGNYDFTPTGETPLVTIEYRVNAHVQMTFYHYPQPGKNTFSAAFIPTAQKPGPAAIDLRVTVSGGTVKFDKREAIISLLVKNGNVIDTPP